MLFYLLDLIGVAVFAISGALAAGRKGLDLLGVVVIAAVTAVGGGTIRDLLLDRHPIFWIDDPAYVFVIGGAATLTLIYVRRNRPPERALLIADAFGLAIFALLGAQIAEAARLTAINVILMGTITAVAGGVLRDVMSAEVPLILRRDIYATAAIAGITAYLLLHGAGVSHEIARPMGMLLVVALRLLAITRGLRLPVFRLPEEDAEE